MLKAERQEQIVQHLTANGTATVGAIARALRGEAAPQAPEPGGHAGKQFS